MDLAVFLDSRCVVCRSPGKLLCSPCHRHVTANLPITVTIEGIPVSAIGPYSGALRQVVRAAKNFRSRHVITTLRDDLRQIAQPFRGLPVIPIPPSRPGYARRGYGLAPVIARHLGNGHLNLLRMVDAGTQRGRSQRERLRHRRFVVHGTAPRRAILVDDVITTGATIRAAITALSAAGCEVVGVIVLAVAGKTPLLASDHEL